MAEVIAIGAIKADGDDVPTVTEAEVNSLMDLVIAKKHFRNRNRIRNSSYLCNIRWNAW